MSDDWHEKLKRLRDQLSVSAPEKLTESAVAKPAAIVESASPTRNVLTSPDNGTLHGHSPAAGGSIPKVAAPAIDVHLGIDFGTRFTKVGIYLPHIGKRDVLQFNKGGLRLLPSRVVLGSDDRHYFINCPDKTPKLLLEYLKIRLASPSAEAFGTTINIGGIPFPDAVRAISAFYLASVLRLSKAAAKERFKAELAPDRKVNWFANVGVPVKHCDSEVLSIFREVAAVAWAWHSRQPWHPTTAELVADYNRTNQPHSSQDLPIQVAPELAAALIHFAEHRNTPAGLYAFLDIGGGTLDGSVFRLKREREGAQFEILSANVDEVGTMASARHFVADAYLNISDIVEKPLIVGGAIPTIALKLNSQIENRIQSLFASVMSQARQRVSGELFTDDEPIILRPGLNKPKFPIVPVYLAGGGCPSEWYRGLFKRTYDEFGHSTWGVGGYDIQTVPAQAGMNYSDYPRFVIAAGLTSDALHFGKYKLPSQTGPAPLPPIRVINAIPYEDSKSLT